MTCNLVVCVNVCDCISSNPPCNIYSIRKMKNRKKKNEKNEKLTNGLIKLQQVVHFKKPRNEGLFQLR